MAVRFALFALLALSCSKEPPVSSDFPVATASKVANDAPEGSVALHPAGKATDDDCPLCGLLGDPEFTMPDGQGGHTVPEDDEADTSEEEEDEEDEAGPSSTSITLTAQPASLREDAGETSITITATLDAVRDEDTTVLVAISSLSTATHDLDYATLAPPSITIPAGSLSGSIEFLITPIADSLQEGSESIQLIGVLEGISTFVEITLSDSRAGTGGASLDGDRAALVAFYHATGGDNWTRNDKWLSDAPISEWYGVHGRRAYVQGRLYEAPSPIIELVLDNNNLRGRIPPELGQLVGLEQLYLSRNQLSGPIPPELGNLSNLRFLELHHNQLSGSIPPELGKLENLIALWLGHNQLSGSIPPELGNLPNLSAANIIGNSFTGCLPSTWRDVSPGFGVESYRLPFCGSNSSGAFNIELVYVHPRALTLAQKALVRQAADRWEEVIRGDLRDVNFASNPLNRWLGSPMNATIRVNDQIDDLRIFVGVQPMDEEVMATGGPFMTRTGSGLPVVAAFVLNPDVLEGWMPDDDLYALILHEMGHCLGFGTIWKNLGLLKEPFADTYFSGFQARQAFDQLGGRAYRGRKVPVEQDGSGHWRTSVFGDELMISGWVWPYRTPLSEITVASLADLGYEVNLDAADTYWVPSTSAAKPVAAETRPGCQILYHPIHVVAEDGRILDTIDP